MTAGEDAGGARCLRRGLKILAELNHRRMAGAAEIAAAIGVPRPTVHRLLLALAADGYARRVAGTEYFVPQEAVAALSVGWDPAARALAAAIPLCDAAADATGWPIDLTVFDGGVGARVEGGAMLVRHSTHDRVGWSLLPRSPIGHHLPLPGTAPGRMYLAGLDRVARQPYLADQPAQETQAVESAERRGFAVRDGGLLPRTLSVAVPVRYDGETLLCISMAVIRAATALEAVIATHVPALRAIAECTKGALGVAEAAVVHRA